MANPKTKLDTGSDEPLSKQSRFSPVTVVAYAAAVVGVVLIVVSGVYIYSKSTSGSDAADFAYSIPDETLDSHLGISLPSVPAAPATGEEPIPLKLKSPDVARFASLYPGDLLNPKYWSAPEWAGSDPFGGPTIPDEFVRCYRPTCSLTLTRQLRQHELEFLRLSSIHR